MIGLQLLALVFALIMVYVAYLHYRRGEINNIEMLFWIIAWLGAVFITIFPNLINSFSQNIPVSRAFDLAVIGGFLLVIPMVYLSYIRSRRTEKKIEDLIRHEALKGVKSVRRLKSS